MALAYLLSPTFEIVNSAGKPATGGYIEVYLAGSRTKYYCASDFNGTLHPFRIPLDSLGSNIVLADDAGTYDIYVYNRYGSLLMSRYNVKAGSGGGIGSITSTDGSIIITPTENGLDLRTNSEAPSILRATAQTLTGDGQFQFSELQRDGQDAVVDTNGRAMVNEGWWHYDATVRLRWPGDPNVNGTQSISLYTANASDSTSFDLSYAHSDTVQVNGEFKAENDGTQFILGVTGVQPGMTVELVDFGIHSIIGEGAGGKYNAGTGIDIDEPNRVISVDFDEVQAKLTAGTGITIDENNVISATEAEIYTVEYTGSSIVEGTALFDEAYAAYQAGKTLVLDWASANWKGSCIGYYSAYGLMFSVEKVNLSGNDATDGFIQYLWLYKYGTQSRWRNSSLKLLPRSDAADAGKVLMVDPEHPTSHPIWQELPAQQQADWTQSDSTAADYIQHKPDLSVYATQTDLTNGLATKQDVISDLATIRAGAALGATAVQDASYIHTDNNFTNADVTKLSGIQAGAEVNVQSDWSQTDTSADDYIKNKPTVDQTYDATSTNAQSGVAVAQALATIDPADIFVATWGTTTFNEILAAYNDGKTLLCKYVNGQREDLALCSNVQTANSQVVSFGFGSTGDFNGESYRTVMTIQAQNGWSTVTYSPINPVQSNWTETDTMDLSYILNKPDLSVYATTSDLTTGLATKQDTINDLATIRSGAASGATAVQPGDLSAVAVSGDYSDLSNTPTIPSGVQLVPTATSADADKVLTVDAQGIPEWAASQGLLIAQYGVTTYEEVDAAALAGKIVYCLTDNNEFAFLAYTNIRYADKNYEFQYYRSNGNPSGTDSVYVYKLRPAGSAYGPVWETTIRPVKAGNISYPVTQVNVNGASAMTGTVANITVPSGSQLVPASTPSDAGEVLTVGQDGTPEWAQAQVDNDSAFLAHYGTTTYAEISDAVAAGKAVFLTDMPLSVTAILPMSSFNTNPAMVMFMLLIGSDEYRATLSSGTWSSSSVNIQANWNEASQLSPSYIQNKPANLVQDASYVHTDNNFTNADVTKLSGIAAGAEVNVQSDWNVTDTSSDAYIANKPTIPAAPMQSDWDESDSSSLAYIQNKPSIPVVPATKPLVAGSNISITENANDVTIAATAAPQVQANWNETDNTDPSYIQNKPTIPTLPTTKPLVAGANITITENTNDVTIAASGGAQVQANWNETDNTDPSYIQNKPTIPAAQVNSDWNAVSGVAEILNKPSIPVIGTITL